MPLLVLLRARAKRVCSALCLTLSAMMPVLVMSLCCGPGRGARPDAHAPLSRWEGNACPCAPD